MQGKVVAIVGAGFSGLTTAVLLLRLLQAPAVVHLIGEHVSFGRGLAYGTRGAEELLNVPAGRMDLSAHPSHSFVRYLEDRGQSYRASDFVPRGTYGDFLVWCLDEAQRQASPGVTLERVHGQVTGIDPPMGGAADRRGKVVLADGRTISASHVVLANGHPSPRALLPLAQVDWASAPLAYAHDHAAATDDLGPQASVLLLGSGLTAIDVASDLVRKGFAGNIVMLSRRGLLSQHHRRHEAIHSMTSIGADFCAGEHSLLAILRGLRAQVRRVQTEQAGDWRDVVGGLRAQTPRLWAQLSPASRRQFMRHLRVHWEAHRHRVAPAVGDGVLQGIRAGQIRVIAGRLLRIDVSGDGFADVSIRLRTQLVDIARRFDRVINCTGPCTDLALVEDGLVRTLLMAGHIRPDALRFGVDTGANYELVSASGEVQRRFYYVGPFLRSTYLEATAVPELRMHAERLALTIAHEVV